MTQQAATPKPLFRTDTTGSTNVRILERDAVRQDFRRVEAAGIKKKTKLSSPEAKRIFANYYLTFQLNVYFIGSVGRARLKDSQVEALEEAIKDRVAHVTQEINRAIDSAEALFKEHQIGAVAEYSVPPMEVEVSVTSSLVNRYLELIHKLDQVMPLLDTLELHEVISAKQQNREKRRLRRETRACASQTRKVALAIRNRALDVATRPVVAQRNAGRDPEREPHGDARDEEHLGDTLGTAETNAGQCSEGADVAEDVAALGTSA